MPSAEVGSAYATLGLDDSKLDSGLSSAKSKFSSAVDAMEGKAKSAGSAIGSALATGVTAAGVALAGVATVGVKSYMDIESAAADAASKMDLSAIAQASGQTTSQAFDSVKEHVMSLADELGQLNTNAFDPTQIAQACANLAAQGFDVATASAKDLAPVLTLATATNYDLADSADMAMSTMNTFGMGVEDLSHIADVYTTACGESAAGMGDLNYALQQAGPVASVANVSFETLTACLETFSQSNIKGEKAGTALRGAINTLITPTKSLTDGLASIGLSMDQVDPRSNDFVDVLKKMKTQADASGQGLSAFTSIFGAEGGLIYKLASSTDTIEEFRNGLLNCDDAATNMAKNMLDNLGGSMDAAMGAASSLAYMIGGKLAPSLRSALDWFSSTGAPAIREFITAIADGNWSQVGDLMSKGVKAGYEKVKDIGKQLYERIKGVNWSGLGSYVTGGISAAWDELKGLGSDLLDTLLDVDWGGIGESIIDSIRDVLDSASDLASDLLDEFSDIDWDSLGEYLFDGLKSGVAKVSDITSSILDAFTEWATGSGPEDIGKAIGEAIVDGLETITEYATSIADAISEWVNGDASSLGSDLGDVIGAALGAVTTIGSGIYDSISTWASGSGPNDLGKAIGKAIGSVLKGVVDIGAGIYNAIKDWFGQSSSTTGIVDVIKTALGAASNWLATGWEVAKGIGQGLVDAFKPYTDECYNSIILFIGGAMVALIGWKGDVKDKLSGIWNFIGTELGTLYTSIETFVTDAGTKLGEWKTTATTIFTDVETAIGGIPEKFQTLVDTIEQQFVWPSIWGDIADDLKELAKYINKIDLSKLTSIFDSLKSYLGGGDTKLTIQSVAETEKFEYTTPSGTVEWLTKEQIAEWEKWKQYLITTAEKSSEIQEEGANTAAAIEKEGAIEETATEKSSVRDIMAEAKTTSTNVMKSIMDTATSAASTATSAAANAAERTLIGSQTAANAITLGGQTAANFTTQAGQAVKIGLDSAGNEIAVIGQVAQQRVTAAGGDLYSKVVVAGSDLQAKASVAGSSLQTSSALAGLTLVNGGTSLSNSLQSGGTAVYGSMANGASAINSASSNLNSAAAAVGAAAAKVMGGTISWSGTPSTTKTTVKFDDPWMNAKKGTSTKGYASGTKTTGPELAVIGEDGAENPEYVIPTKKKRWDLLYAAMRAYGIPGYAEGTSTGADSSDEEGAKNMTATFGITGLAEMASSVKRILNNLKDFFRITWDVIKSEGATYWKSIDKVITTNVTAMRDSVWASLIDIRNTAISSNAAILTSTKTAWDGFLTTITPSLTSVKEGIVSSFSSAATGSKTAIDTMITNSTASLQAFRVKWQEIWTGLVTDMTTAQTSITAGVTAIAEQLKKISVSVNITSSSGGGGSSGSGSGYTTTGVSASGLGEGNSNFTINPDGSASFTHETLTGPVLTNALKYTSPSGVISYINPLNNQVIQTMNPVTTTTTGGGGGGSTNYPAGNYAASAATGWKFSVGGYTYILPSVFRAAGTKTAGPEFAMIGEDGPSYPEYVIPTKTKRWDLLNAAMHDYGVPGYAGGMPELVQPAVSRPAPSLADAGLSAGASPKIVIEDRTEHHWYLDGKEVTNLVMERAKKQLQLRGAIPAR